MLRKILILTLTCKLVNLTLVVVAAGAEEAAADKAATSKAELAEQQRQQKRKLESCLTMVRAFYSATEVSTTNNFDTNP